MLRAVRGLIVVSLLLGLAASAGVVVRVRCNIGGNSWDAPFASVMPGQDFPEGMAIKADSLAELAAVTGIDAQGLADTVARFNHHAAQGQDPDFGRGTHVWSAWMCGDPTNQPHPNLGTLEQGPFYAVPLHRFGGSAIAAAGLLADHHCRAIGWEGPLHRCSIYANEEAGRRLREMMAMGASQPWPDALEAISGTREMDATAILDYFAPLKTWLDEQNAGRQCGW